MPTLHDLFVRHGGMPEGGFSTEEVNATNRMTEGEYASVMDEWRERRRSLGAMGREREELRRSRELEAATLDAGVPRRYASVAIDSRHVGDMASGRGTWIYGGVGTGKTMAACSELRGWIASGRTRALFSTTVGMLSDLRDAMFAHSEASATERYAMASLLVLDDLDKEPPTARALSKLFEVIDARYAAGRPTVVTSQRGPSEIGAYLGSGGDAETASAIVSRLSGSCAVMRTAGADRRVHG